MTEVVKVYSGNFARFLVSRNYWYLRREKDENGRYYEVFVVSHLYKELQEIYEADKKSFNTYKQVTSTKAQA